MNIKILLIAMVVPWIIVAYQTWKITKLETRIMQYEFDLHDKDCEIKFHERHSSKSSSHTSSSSSTTSTHPPEDK